MVVTQAPNPLAAVSNTNRNDINPGGQVVIGEVLPEYAKHVKRWLEAHNQRKN